MCGIPTIVIRDKNTTWLESSLKIFNDFPNALVMDYGQFVMCDINSIPIIEITSHQVGDHEKYFFSQSSVIECGQTMGQLEH